jgi:uncharacterized protein
LTAPTETAIKQTCDGRLRDDSDIDLLVEFEPGDPRPPRRPNLELELRELLGREGDLRTVGDLSLHFREAVIAAARER